MKQQNTGRSSKLVALMAGAALLGLVSQGAMALTAAGTPINNTATLSYSVGAVVQTPIISTTASFIVDQMVNLNVTSNALPTNVTPGQTGAVTAFLVTNTGNAAQGYTFVAANAAANPAANGVAPFTLNNFNATGLQVFVSANPAATLATAYVPGTDIATNIPTLAVGASQVVYVVGSIPLTALNAQQSVVSLLATATAPTTMAALVNAVVNTPGMDVVFADGAGVVDVAKQANFSAYNGYLVKSASISVTKSVALLCDPVNGNVVPMNIPGSVVQYAVTITNTGSTAATLATISDALAASLAFDPKLINGVGAGAVCTSAAGVSLSATGFAAVTGAIPLAAPAPATYTTYLAPGLAAQAATITPTPAPAATPGATVTVDFATLAIGAVAVLPGASLPGAVAGTNMGSFVTVYFNAIVQ